MCMTLRGVQKPGATTYTAFFTGAYDERPELRAEIWAILASSGMTASAAAASAAFAADAAAAAAAAATSAAPVGAGSCAVAAPARPPLPQATGGAGHGAHGLGSPRFAREGPAVVRGELPAAAIDHVAAAAGALAVSTLAEN